MVNHLQLFVFFLSECIKLFLEKLVETRKITVPPGRAGGLCPLNGGRGEGEGSMYGYALTITFIINYSYTPVTVSIIYSNLQSLGYRKKE